MTNAHFRTRLRPTFLAVSIAQACLYMSAVHAQSIEQNATEVVISGSKAKPLKADNSKAAGFINQALIDTPFSLHVLTAQQMQDLQIRLTTDAMKYDASVNDAYNAVGYAEQFSIRGVPLDNESSYRKDGFTISGDTSIPLENKERIEVLKGISGFQSGFATPGGIINYVTKRPTNNDLRSITTEVSERGNLYGAIDLGGLSSDKQFGYRINAAAERLRSYVKGANGERQFVSAAFDWHLSPAALLQLDMDYQYKSQLTAPGFQLFNGTDLPTGISADMMLNNQPWAKPVTTRSSNLGLRFEYQLENHWTASIAANRNEFKRNDYTAFPYGCGAIAGYCANGDYDVYDYQSVGEHKTLWGTQWLLNGKFSSAGIRHELATGLTNSERSDYFGNYVYDYVGTSNIFHPVAVAQSGNVTGPVLLQRTDKEWSAFVQDVISLSDAWKVHAGIRHLHITRTQLGVDGYDRGYWVSNAALVYKPQQNLSFYTSFAQGLEHGGVAPFGTLNQNVMLNPARSRQFEIGSKADLSKELSISAALFRIRKPLEYTDASNTYVQNGNATNTGLELSAQGKLNRQWSLGASLSDLRAVQSDTGNPDIDGKRVLNVPKLKTTIYTDYAVAAIPGLNLNASWQYAGNKAYSPDNSVIVPGYQITNLGARYVTKIGNTTTILRFNADNVFNKFYWRDATQLLGGYLFAGAPRNYRLSAQFDF